MPRRHISASTSLDTLKKEAKRWLKALRDSDAQAVARFKAVCPAGSEHPVLRDVQHALAREHGFDGWRALKQAVEAAAGAPPPTPRLRTVKEYESVAADFVAAFDARDTTALQRLNDHYHRSFTFDDLFAEIWRRNYAFRQRSSRVPKNYLPLEEARLLVAQDVGFGSWPALLDAVANNLPPVPAFAVDEAASKIAPRRRLGGNEWDALVAEMKERRITSIEANGMITDDALARIAELDHVTSLSLGGSPQLSDAGLLQLARMPQLRRLDLSGYPRRQPHRPAAGGPA